MNKYNTALRILESWRRELQALKDQYETQGAASIEGAALIQEYWRLVERLEKLAQDIIDGN